MSIDRPQQAHCLDEPVSMYCGKTEIVKLLMETRAVILRHTLMFSLLGTDKSHERSDAMARTGLLSVYSHGLHGYDLHSFLQSWRM